MISSDLFYRVIEDGRKMNIINVTLSGGEPLLHEDFVEFLIKCRELDLSVNVLTNLTLLTDRIIAVSYTHLKVEDAFVDAFLERCDEEESGEVDKRIR